MVGDGERQSVRGVGGRQHGEPERGANEQHDLALVGLTAPRDGAFDPGRRVLRDPNGTPREAKQDDAPRVSELGGRLGVLVEEQRFHGADVWLEAGDHVVQALFDRVQA
jgi:hypothetical protein